MTCHFKLHKKFLRSHKAYFIMKLINFKFNKIYYKKTIDDSFFGTLNYVIEVEQISINRIIFFFLKELNFLPTK